MSSFFQIFQAVSEGVFRVVKGPISSKIYFTNLQTILCISSLSVTSREMRKVRHLLLFPLLRKCQFSS